MPTSTREAVPRCSARCNDQLTEVFRAGPNAVVVPSSAGAVGSTYAALAAVLEENVPTRSATHRRMRRSAVSAASGGCSGGTYHRRDDGRGAHVATASFMVASTVRGHGVGRALGTHVIDWARDGGYRGIQFNAVVENNAGAVALWQSLGFEIVGTVPEAFDHPTDGLVALHVMYRCLVQPRSL